MSEDLSPAAEALHKFIRDFAETWAAELERIRPGLERIAEVANRPDVRAALEQASTRRPICDWQPCHCLCPRSHPDDMGVCDGEGITTRRYVTEAMGTVDVLLCAPCAVAQGLAELSGPSA